MIRMNGRMKQIIMQLDERTAELLERIAPGHARKRSAFLRKVIARAVQEELEKQTQAAYARWPDEPIVLDPSQWAPEEEAMHPAPERPRRRAARARLDARPKRRKRIRAHPTKRASERP
jgi:predicted transcriptional regulator